MTDGDMGKPGLTAMNTLSEATMLQNCPRDQGKEGILLKSFPYLASSLAPFTSSGSPDLIRYLRRNPHLRSAFGALSSRLPACKKKKKKTTST